MVSPRRFVIALAVLAAAPLESAGQGLTGTLVGTVQDSGGGALPGAQIRLVSPALLGGERRATSDEKGQWRLHVLPPGTYELTVDLAPKFTRRQLTLSIGAGETVERTVALALAGTAESVTVTAGTINARTTGLETRFGPEYIRRTPSRRNSMFDLIGMAPGMSPTSPSSGTVNTVSAFGSAVNENAFLIDGTNFTCPCQGVSRAEPIIDVIQELHVQSMGASVEFGNLQGAVFNVVTKQGTDRFAGEASYYGQPSALTAQPVRLPVPRTADETGYGRERYRDLTASIGGPIAPGRLWFFAAYQYLRDYDSQPGTAPSLPRKYEQNKIFGKLNSRLTPALHMMHSFHREAWVNPAPPTIAAPFETTSRVHASVPNMTFVSLTHVLSNRTLWEARVGRFLLRQDGDPSSGDRTTPPHTDEITGIASGNVAQMSTLLLDRVSAKVVFHRYQAGLFGVDHQLRAGAAFERGLHRLIGVIPGGVRYNDRNGAPFQAIFREPAIAGGVFVTPAIFVSDSVRLKGRVTIDAGVRFDHSRAINPGLPVIDAEGRETDAIRAGVGTLYTINVVSPRLGVNVGLDRAGRTMLRSSYGRFNQGILTGELDPISQGTTTITTREFEAATGGYTRLVSEIRPGVNVALDPETRTPHTDEFSLAIDRELRGQMRASAAYIRKRGSDYIAWIDQGGQYRDETRTLADGTIIPVRVLTNATSDRRFVLTNPGTQFVHYDGLVLALDRRSSGRWSASTSYTFSRARGVQVMSNGAAEDAQFSTIARPSFLTFGQDPNDLTNAEGRLPNDRPHVFRANGAVRLPWQDLRVAVNVQHFSGKPWAASTQVSLPQGSRKILLEPRGARRLSARSLVDLRVARSLRTGSAGTIELMADVLNLLNDAAEEALTSENPASQTFGRPRQFIDPRRVMFGVRVNFR